MDGMVTLIDWHQFRHAREALGPNFWRTLIYLRDEGSKCIGAIETALRRHDAVGIIGPAETLKSEAFQMGAKRVAEIAEQVEMEARDCVEMHDTPDLLIESVVALRQAFTETVEALQKDISPLMVREKTIPPTFATEPAETHEVTQIRFS